MSYSEFAANQPRTITIFVKDSRGNPLPGATVSFSVDGMAAGVVPGATSEGRGRIDPPLESDVEVSAEYEGVTKGPVKLSPEACSYTFTFGVIGEYTQMPFLKGLVILIIGVCIFSYIVYLANSVELAPIVIGLMLLFICIGIVFSINDLNKLQQQMLRSMFSLSLGAVASGIPGILNVKISLGSQVAIAATGAIAVWLIVFFFKPAGD